MNDDLPALTHVTSAQPVGETAINLKLNRHPIDGITVSGLPPNTEILFCATPAGMRPAEKGWLKLASLDDGKHDLWVKRRAGSFDLSKFDLRVSKTPS